MKNTHRIYLVVSAIAMLAMNIAGWMRPYAVTGCFFLVGLALLLGGDKDRGE